MRRDQLARIDDSGGSARPGMPRSNACRAGVRLLPSSCRHLPPRRHAAIAMPTAWGSTIFDQFRLTGRVTVIDELRISAATSSRRAVRGEDAGRRDGRANPGGRKPAIWAIGRGLLVESAPPGRARRPGPVDLHWPGSCHVAARVVGQEHGGRALSLATATDAALSAVRDQAPVVAGCAPAAAGSPCRLRADCTHT